MANHSPTPWLLCAVKDETDVYDRGGCLVFVVDQPSPLRSAEVRKADIAALSVAAESLQRLADLAEACRRLSPSYCADRGCAQIDDDSFDAILEEAVALLEHVTDEGLVLDPFPDDSGVVPTDGGEHC